MRQLIVVHLGSGGVVQEPVGSTANGGETDIDTDGHVTEKQPGGDQSLFRGPKIQFEIILKFEIEMALRAFY